MSDEVAAPLELSPREKGFVAALIRKYPGGKSADKDLFRSLVVFTGMLVGAHLVERFVPTWWLPFIIIYVPAVWLFSRYRKFSIFRSCVLSKVGARLARYEPMMPPRPENAAQDGDSKVGAHPHGRR